MDKDVNGNEVLSCHFHKVHLVQLIYDNSCSLYYRYKC